MSARRAGEREEVAVVAVMAPELDHAPVPPPLRLVRAPASRIHGGVVFTDIVAFTAEHGDATALEVLDRQLEVVRRTIPSGARIVKEIGDGLLLWFDDAARTVPTARRLRDAFAGAALPVRVGAHTGEVSVRGSDVVGHTVNVAARIAGRAGAGEVLVSAAAAAIAGVDVGYELLGPVALAGVPSPVTVLRVA